MLFICTLNEEWCKENENGEAFFEKRIPNTNVQKTRIKKERTIMKLNRIITRITSTALALCMLMSIASLAAFADSSASVVKNLLPMQETLVWSLIQEDPTRSRATRPERHNYWACALEPRNHNYWAHTLQSPSFTAREATATRSPYPEMSSSPCSPYEEKSPCSNRDPAQPKINKYIKLQRKTKQNKTKKQSWGCLLTVVSCQLVY